LLAQAHPVWVCLRAAAYSAAVRYRAVMVLVPKADRRARSAVANEVSGPAT